MLTFDQVMHGSVLQRNARHASARALHCLLYGDRLFARLTLAHADPSIAVTDDGQRGKTKDASALDHFGHTIDGDHLFLDAVVTVFGINALGLKACHVASLPS